jgi:phage head maturation protease
MSPTITTGQRLQLTATRSARIRAKSSSNTLGTFEGNAYTGAPMKPGGWWQPVIIDLDGVKIPSQHRPVLRQHDHQVIVGHTTEVKATRKGLMVAGVFSGEQKHRDSVTIPARNGFQWQLSVGADPARVEHLEAGETAVVNGREVVGPMTISRETELGEISFVPLGADGGTSVSIAASAPGFTYGNIMQQAHADEVRRIQAAFAAAPSAPPASTRRIMDFNPGLSALAGDADIHDRAGGHALEARADQSFRQAPPYYSEGAIAAGRHGVLPDRLKGVALVFGALWLAGPRYDADFRRLSGEERPVIAPGALDDALRDFRSGKVHIPLLLNHDRNQWLTDSDECHIDLRLSKDSGRVLFGMNADTTAGRMAARVIASSGFSGISLGLVAQESVEVPEVPGGRIVTRAGIRDISIVAVPRCPGCRLTAA